MLEYRAYSESRLYSDYLMM